MNLSVPVVRYRNGLEPFSRGWKKFIRNEKGWERKAATRRLSVTSLSLSLSLFEKSSRERVRHADQIFGAVDGQHGENKVCPSAAALIRFAPCFSTAERRPGAMLPLSCRRHRRDRRILKRATPSPSLPPTPTLQPPISPVKKFNSRGSMRSLI